MACRLGSALGTLAYHSSRRYRRVALHNLRRAFPEWDETSCRRVARQTFQNFGKSFAEFLKASSLSLEELQQRVQLQGREHIEAARAEGKGVLLITGHFGNWELMARYLTALGYPISVIARETDDPATTELVTALRERSGYKVFLRGNAVRYVLGCLRRNELVGILPDQNAGDVFIEFFGQKAGCVAGPALFHLRTGAPLVPLFNVRLPGDFHRIEVLPPLRFTPTGRRQEDYGLVLQSFHDALEAYIRRYPTQWLWFHDRWKSAREQVGG